LEDFAKLNGLVFSELEQFLFQIIVFFNTLGLVLELETNCHGSSDIFVSWLLLKGLKLLLNVEILIIFELVSMLLEELSILNIGLKSLVSVLLQLARL
jgi:hypothetical protein